PIAMAASPTCTSLELPNWSGCRTDWGASTLITPRSVEGSVPTAEALYVAPFQNWTDTVFALSTTWSFVTMCPESSITKPEPCAVCDCCWPNGFDWDWDGTVISK